MQTLISKTFEINKSQDISYEIFKDEIIIINLKSGKYFQIENSGVEIFKNIKKSIKKMDISDKQKQTLLKESESFINRTHGTLKEESAIVIYEKRFDVKLDTSQEFFKKRIECNSNSNFDWYIGGRIDGLYIDKQDKNKSYIVYLYANIFYIYIYDKNIRFSKKQSH